MLSVDGVLGVKTHLEASPNQLKKQSLAEALHASLKFSLFSLLKALDSKDVLDVCIGIRVTG